MPCGHAGDPAHPCICPAADVLRYRSRLSGPLADRIDLHITMPAVPLAELATRGRGDESAAVRARVERARACQRTRYDGYGRCNARAPGRWLETHGGVEPAARQLLTSAGERPHLSVRAFHRVLRVARTIADLEDESAVRSAQCTCGRGARLPAASDVDRASDDRVLKVDAPVRVAFDIIERMLAKG